MTDDRSDYLWDRSGEADPDVAHLEEVLGTLGHRGSLPALPPREAPVPAPPVSRRSLRGVFLGLTAAAMLCLIAGAAWFAVGARHLGWAVERLAGTAGDRRPGARRRAAGCAAAPGSKPARRGGRG